MHVGHLRSTILGDALSRVLGKFYHYDCFLIYCFTNFNYLEFMGH